MAQWPTASELAQVLDITSGDWDETIDRVNTAAILKVKQDVGMRGEDYEDEPDDSLSQAALRMGELMGTRPGTDARSLGSDPTYRALISGHRRVFGIA